MMASTRGSMPVRDDDRMPAGMRRGLRYGRVARLTAASAYCHRSRIAWGVVVAVTCIAGVSHDPIATCLAQDARKPVEINLADNESLNLEALIRLTANRLGLKILYDDSLVSKQGGRIIIRGKAVVQAETLLELLQATLRVHGLALVDADVGDFKRIVRLEHARPFVRQGTTADVGRAEYVTEIFQLRNVSVQMAEAYVRSFSTQGNASGSQAQASSAFITTIPDAGLLIVTDLATSMKRIEELVARIDVPTTKSVYRFLPVKNLEATELKRRLDEILASGNLFGRPAGIVSSSRDGKKT
ncbi:MAG TPA: hypothetical protein ENJ50_02360, partial [Planctomycetaceae bacterium]|nr:hypothetical protein [Planctomycetaceae bacterium]